MASAEDKPSIDLNPPAQGAQQQISLSIDTGEMSSSYSNFFRVTGTFEEVVIDFGLHSGLVSQSGPEAIKVTDRVVMSFATTKRLLGALQMAVARHEQMFGAIEVDPQKRLRPQGGRQG